MTQKTIQLAGWTTTLQRSLLRDMVAVVARPGVLSFAGGLPAPELFPVKAYGEAVARVLATDPLALQYRPPFAPLREQITQLMALRAVACGPDEVIVTTGAQQGLDVLARLLMNPGGQMLMEETVYPGAQQVVAPFRPEILAVQSDLESGMDVAAVEAHLARGARPAFIYAIPEAHNPLGVSMSLEKRQWLVELARHYGVPIVEDDPYGLLCYEPPALPALRALDEEWVIYLGTFSKIMAPALRTGWIVAPKALLPKLTIVKEACDLESSGLTQRAIAAYLEAGHLPDHLGTLRHAYGARRTAMLRALAAHFPATARWSIPTGGMFIWVTLPEGTDSSALLHFALEQEQVAFVPGTAFAINAHPRAPHCLRLSFATATVEQIEDGIARLGQVINAQLSVGTLTHSTLLTH